MKCGTTIRTIKRTMKTGYQDQGFFSGYGQFIEYKHAWTYRTGRRIFLSPPVAPKKNCTRIDGIALLSVIYCLVD